MAFCLAGMLLFYSVIIPTSVSAASGGNGSKENPYRISNQEDLQGLLDDMLEAMIDGESLSGYYLMTNDIRLSKPLNTSVLIDYTKSDSYTIGAVKFSGTFSGGGYTIHELAVEDPFKAGVFTSLFEYNEGTIQDLGITLSTSGTFSYGCSPLVGTNAGMIKNCTVYGTMNAGMPYLETSLGMITGSNQNLIQDCSASGEIRVNSVSMGYVGGIAGKNSGRSATSQGGRIIKSNSSVNITVNRPAHDVILMTGGVVGGNYGTISECTAESFQILSIGAPSTWRLDSCNYIYGGGISGVNGTNGSITKCTASGSLYASSYLPATIKLGGIYGTGDGSASENTDNIGMLEQGETSSSVDPSQLQAVVDQNLAPDGKPNCILCNNTGERKCHLCHGKGSVISGAFMEGGWTGDGWVGEVTCQICGGTGSLDCYCGR